jgi:HEAT repeat protein
MPNQTNYESARDAEFKLNEPPKYVPGGAQRVSRRVTPTDYPNVQRRLRLNRLLLMHDPEVAEENLAQIEEEDLPVLRRMAQESILSGNTPVLRRNAIAALSRFPTVENLNLLTELAQYGEDSYVRGASLTALANTNLAMALPLLKEGLAGRDLVEYRRAQEGLLRLAAEFGTGSIEDLMVRERRKTVRRRLTVVLDELSREGATAKAQREPREVMED